MNKLVTSVKTVKTMNRRVYLDYAATTPLDPRVFEAMEPFLEDKFGNPSSVHSWGQEARAAIDEAREQVSKLSASRDYFYQLCDGSE